MRLFVGVDLSIEAKEAIGRALEPIRPRFPRARWVKPEKLHLTLAFLDEVAGAELSRVGLHLSEKLEQGGRLTGRLAGLGAFPPAGKVKVVWMGLEPAERFAQLAERVREALAAAGASFDAKPFRSHVTLARCDPPWPARARADLAATSSSLTELLSSVSIDCDRVTLFSSVLSAGGPSYRSELEVQLVAPRGAGTL